MLRAPPQAQLGMKGAVSERAPQKYLIQNHSGVRLFYWAERVRSKLCHYKLGPLSGHGTASATGFVQGHMRPDLPLQKRSTPA